MIDTLKKYGISEAALAEVFKVLEHGDRKHPGMEWKTQDSEDHLAHAMTHVSGYAAGYGYELESKCHHLAHAITRLLFALSQDLEDR